MSRIVRTMICSGGTNAPTIGKKTMTATMGGAPHAERASGSFAAAARLRRHGVLLDLARAATDRVGDTARGVLIALDRRLAQAPG